MRLVDQSIARVAGRELQQLPSLMDDAARLLSRASTKLDGDVLADVGMRKIMANANSHLKDAVSLVRTDAPDLTAVSSNLRSARFGIDLLLPYGRLY